MCTTRSIFAIVGGAAALACACAASGWCVNRLALPDDSWRWPAVAASHLVPIAGAFAVFVGMRRRTIQRMTAALSVDGPPSLDVASAPVLLAPLARVISERLNAATQKQDQLSVRLREAEIRLSIAEAERRHGEAILHSLRDAVLVTDQFNELTLANASAARLLGFDPGDAAHKPIDHIVKDEGLSRLIKEVRQSGMVSKQRHVEHAMPPASSTTPASFDVTIACLPGAGAQPKDVGGVVTILRDITREKEISQMKSDFVSQASHELRTPIASINAYVEMLLDAEAQDEATRQEFYGIIKSEAERLSRMIDNMLNISRIEAGIISVEAVEVDFAKVIREVIETMQPQAKEKKIMLLEKIGPLIYTAQADRDMMHQVILNLVSNGIKYTPENGRVTVSVENDDASRSILVAVQDTGFGIPPEALDKVFGKFFRIESYKRMAKGTGLGLNLVKHIIETVHRGQVGVSSQVGMGSRFWFTVPFEFQSGG